MTGPEALDLLRRMRSFAGDEAAHMRTLGLSGAHPDREAEALSWAITTIEAATAERRTPSAWGGPL